MCTVCGGRMCVAHLLSALTAGAVLVVQLRCTALACVLWPLAALRPCIADRPIYVQAAQPLCFWSALPGSPRPRDPATALSVAKHHVDA
jgi:hypothetical protein